VNDGNSDNYNNDVDDIYNDNKNEDNNNRDDSDVELPIVMHDLCESTDNFINLYEHLNAINSLIFKTIQIISMINDMAKRKQLIEDATTSENTITSVFTPEEED
ncbi:12978_t:CDS:2, partial [Dentiscutata erythropus]